MEKDGISDFSSWAASYFVTFDPKGHFMKEVFARCKRIYAGERKRLAEEAAKIVISIGLPEARVYEKFGDPISTTENVTANGIEKQLNYGSDHQIQIVNGRVASWKRVLRQR